MWIILDFYKEFGGTVLREDEAVLVVRTPEGEERTVDRNSIVSIVSLLDDPPGTKVHVLRRDGRKIAAILEKDDFQSATVRIAGVRTELLRRQILGLEVDPPFEQRLQEYRQGIPKDAIELRLTMIRWIMQEGHPDIALEELKPIRRDFDSEEARRLQSLAESELRMKESRQRRAGEITTPASPDRPSAVADDQVPRLSARDVNLIRLMEIDLANPPRIELPPDLVQDIRTNYADSPLLPATPQERERMNHWSSDRIVKLLFELKARDLYERVNVMQDPEHLQTFRRDVQSGWLIPNCATSRCHGGDRSGRFLLATTDSRDPTTAYTNLWILLNFKTADGRPMIDFDKPEESVLLGHAQSASGVGHPHPAVPGYTPAIEESRKSKLTDAIAWIRGMHRPRPSYPISYTLKTPPPCAERPPTASDER